MFAAPAAPTPPMSATSKQIGCLVCVVVVVVFRAAVIEGALWLPGLLERACP
jgi:hypothetical protein